MYLLLYTLLTLLSAFSSAAQVVPKADTLPPAMKEAIKGGSKSISERVIKVDDFSTMISPIGEADFVKYIQTLPGIVCGSDGSSSFYVRGGNMGGNVQTLDGVPIYGTSHLIGLTTSYPSDVISSADFLVGGFTSEEGNLISSHIRLHSKDGSFDKRSIKADLGNAILGAYLSTPLIENKLSLNAAVRVSPALLEYNCIKAIADSSRINIAHADAAIYDIYAKMKYRINQDRNMSVTLFHSMDSYSFKMNSGSDDSMSWNNAIVLVQYNAPWQEKGTFNVTGYFNHYGNSQGMIKQLESTLNNLQIRSIMDETAIQANVNTLGFRNAKLQYGIRIRAARFNPGSARMLKTTGVFPKTSSPLVKNVTWTATGTVHGQMELGNPERNLFRMAGRVNYNTASGIIPEASVLLRMHILQYMGFEVTGDYISQFYHTLEGIPLGWSLDMIMAPSKQFKPELSKQVFSGLFFNSDKHFVSAGAYYKKMDNLIYYSDASKLFDSSIAGWSEHIEVGKGSSRGIELLYKKNGDVLNWQFSYTWSKTDRLFENLNDGNAFPAKYDRTHVLNAVFSWRLVSDETKNISLSTQYTYQSGHLETVPAGTWYDDNYITGHVEREFYTTQNNYRMPPYIRCDVSAVLELIKCKYPQTVILGIYNLLNRHNPFCLSYDPENDEWSQISLMPILPSIKYTIAF